MVNLEMQVNKTQAGIYTVTYGSIGVPLNVQEAAFAVHGLDIVSPAQLGFLRANDPYDTFNSYSRTDADVFYDDRGRGQVVIVPGEEISKLVGISNLVDAHRQGREYVIPEAQRDLVYAMVDEMLKSGIAFVAPDGRTEVQTSKFGKNDLTSRLFSDPDLGIDAQEYGDWLKSKGKDANTFYMDVSDYSKVQKGPYLNRLRVYGHDFDFNVLGINWFLNLNYGAFGVHFEKSAEGGQKK